MRQHGLRCSWHVAMAGEHVLGAVQETQVSQALVSQWHLELKGCQSFWERKDLNSLRAAFSLQLILFSARFCSACLRKHASTRAELGDPTVCRDAEESSDALVQIHLVGIAPGIDLEAVG
eukprot:2427340-Amphidinium_carterae.1